MNWRVDLRGRITRSTLFARFIKGAFWVLLGAILSRVFTLLASVAAARMLGKLGFGQFGMIQSTIGMFGTLAGFGLGLTAAKYVAESRHQDTAAASRVITLSSVFALFSGFVLALALWWCSPWLADRILHAPELGSSLRVASVLLFVAAQTGAQTGCLSGFEAFYRIALINVICGVLSLPVTFGCVEVGMLSGAVWAQLIINILMWFLNQHALIQVAREECIQLFTPLSRNDWRIVWAFSLPAALGGTLVGPITWFCNMLLVNGPNGYGELALYNAASQWRAALLFIPATLGNLFLPMLASLWGQADEASFRKVLWGGLALNTACGIVFGFPLALLSKRVMGAYGPGFAEGWPVLVLVASASAIISVNNQLSRIVASVGRMWASFGFDAAWALTFLMFCYLLVPRRQSVGMGWALLFSAILQLTVQMYYLKRYILGESRRIIPPPIEQSEALVPLH